LNGTFEELMKDTPTHTKSSSTRTRVVPVRRQDSIHAAAPEARAYARVRSTKTFRRSLFKFASVFLTLCLLAPAVAAFSSKGQKNYKQGLQYEAAQQWEKAAEEFSLAVAADPSNTEYQLHYRRAVFNASQVFAQQGATLMERGDYLGAYNAFRRAYGYDQSNELARSMMERAFRLQMGGDEQNKAAPAPASQQTAASIAPAGYASDPAAMRRAVERQDDSVAPSRAEQLSAVQFSGDLQKFIKYLARQLKLNVVFDRDFPTRNVEVDLQDVTPAQALDYIFLTQGLFFQKLSNRTILVAEQVKRPQYQQLVLRTFYLYNVDPNDARTLITASIPPQAGRQPVITANKATNSITVRDTPENVRLISQLLKSIDKERAEVVMDVNIYEVSRADLMQLGNQIGNSDSLVNLGGIQKGLSVLGGSREVVTQAVATPTALGAALLIPATALSALQRRDNTRLVASTQVHAFDGEKSTAHIGQRVPVQTATVAPFGSVTTGDNNNQPGVTQGAFGGNGFPVIQYEKTGLTLEFTPQVFPNLDVQVKMNIKSNDVTTTQGGPALTPTFTERNIEGTARIQNNRTMMIASVAQNSQSRGRQGLPLIGLVPVLGRMFSAPRNDDHQTDIVIAVTPHVMRASTVTPQDEEMRPSGTLQTPTTETLEAMLQEVSREEQLAAARAIPTHARVELPASVETSPATVATINASATVPASANTPAPTTVPASVAARPSTDAASPSSDVASSSEDASKTEAPTFIPAPKPLMNAVSEQPAARPAPREAVISEPAGARKPAEGNSLFSFQQTAQTNEQTRAREAALAREASPSSETPASVNVATTSLRTSAPATSAASFRLMSDPTPMHVGERRQLRIFLKTDAPLGLVALTLRLDTRVLSVRSVSGGTLFTESDAWLTQTFTPEGLLLVSLAPSSAQTAISGAGVLLVVEVEALANGAQPLSFNSDDVHLVATDGRKVLLRVTTDQVSVGR
jgi:general secretion pathway protein D